jgi:hypothetical protein
MKITRNVITDLMPVYQSGEASQDTLDLVENFLQGDPEFARIVNAQPETLLAENPPALPHGTEMETLKKTRKLLKKRTYFMAFAIVFTLSTFSFNFDSTGIRWNWVETPILAVVFLAIGILFWVMYAQTVGKLKGSDL